MHSAEFENPLNSKTTPIKFHFFSQKCIVLLLSFESFIAKASKFLVIKGQNKMKPCLRNSNECHVIDNKYHMFIDS